MAEAYKAAMVVLNPATDEAMEFTFDIDAEKDPFYLIATTAQYLHGEYGVGILKVDLHDPGETSATA